MAKKKKAAKGGKFGVIASVVTLVLSVLCFVFLATPVVKTVTKIGNTTTTEQKTAYEYTKYYQEKVDSRDENGNKVQITRLQEYKNEIKEIKKYIKESNLSEEKKKEANENIKELSAPVRICETIIATEAIAAIAMVAALIALILFALKKNGAAGILNLVALLGLFAIFITACVMQAEVNNYFKFEYSADELLNIKTSSVAPALVLAFSLIGTLAGGVLTVVGKKK